MKNIFFLSLMLMIASASHGQLIKKIGERAKNRAENNANNKVNNAVDKTVDEAMNPDLKKSPKTESEKKTGYYRKACCNFFKSHSF